MTPATATLTIRELTDRDARALDRLASLDTRPTPRAPVIGAEVGGRLLAAVSVDDGSSVADPFSRTAEVLDLLRMRAVGT